MSRKSTGLMTFQGTDLVMRAVNGIDAMIADGRLVPGQRLVEGDLSEQLNVPHSRVREALRILAGSGAVELAPYKSAKVRQFPKTEIAALFETAVGLCSSALVGLAFRYPSLSNEDKTLFSQSSQTLSSAARTAPLSDMIALMLEYNHLISSLSGNAILERMMSQLRLNSLYKSLTELVPEQLLRESNATAVDIEHAIARSEPAVALAIMWRWIEPILGSLHSTNRARPEHS